LRYERCCTVRYRSASASVSARPVARLNEATTLTSRRMAARRAISDWGGHGGQVDEGLRLLAEALAVVDNTGERWWEAELHRLMGELLLRQAAPAAPHAETCLHQAPAVARRQQAKSWELRAAMSLGRLWQPCYFRMLRLGCPSAGRPLPASHSK
jgi:predicted ATPase